MDTAPMIVSGRLDDRSGTTEPPDRPLGDQAVLVMDVGNSSIALGAWDALTVYASCRVALDDFAALSAALDTLGHLFPNGHPQTVVISSVVPTTLAGIRDALVVRDDPDVLVVGQDLPLPIPVEVGEPDQVGTDRVCTAAAAYECIQRACTVVDFGTAVTIDLVDDDGTFVGGAILPGLNLQAQALADGAAMLPRVEPTPPQQAVGKDTVEAIRSGICFGLPGAVRSLVERYAAELNTWPQVVATGGDLSTVLELCDFIDTPVPDLTLLGIGLAHARYVASSPS